MLTTRSILLHRAVIRGLMSFPEFCRCWANLLPESSVRTRWTSPVVKFQMLQCRRLRVNSRRAGDSTCRAAVRKSAGGVLAEKPPNHPTVHPSRFQSGSWVGCGCGRARIGSANPFYALSPDPTRHQNVSGESLDRDVVEECSQVLATATQFSTITELRLANSGAGDSGIKARAWKKFSQHGP